MSKELKYDPDIHVTAGELRELYDWDLGDVPDCAHIRRGAWRMTNYACKQDEEEETKFNFSGNIEFTEPFHWIKGTYKIVEKD